MDSVLSLGDFVGVHIFLKVSLPDRRDLDIELPLEHAFHLREHLVTVFNREETFLFQ